MKQKIGEKMEKYYGTVIKIDFIFHFTDSLFNCRRIGMLKIKVKSILVI